MKKVSKKYNRLVIMVLAAITLAMVHLYIQNKSIGLNYEYARTKVAFQQLYDQNRDYNNMVGQRSSLERVEKIAKEKIGMEYPENIRYVVGSGEAQ